MTQLVTLLVRQLVCQSASASAPVLVTQSVLVTESLLVTQLVTLLVCQSASASAPVLAVQSALVNVSEPLCELQ